MSNQSPPPHYSNNVSHENSHLPRQPPSPSRDGEDDENGSHSTTMMPGKLHVAGGKVIEDVLPHERLLLTPSSNNTTDSFMSMSLTEEEDHRDRMMPLSPILYGPAFRHIWDKENMDPLTNQFITPRSFYPSPGQQQPPLHNYRRDFRAGAKGRRRPGTAPYDLKTQESILPSRLITRYHTQMDSRTPEYHYQRQRSSLPREPLSDITESFLSNHSSESFLENHMSESFLSTTSPASTTATGASRQFNMFAPTNTYAETQAYLEQLHTYPRQEHFNFDESLTDKHVPLQLFESSSLLLSAQSIYENLSSASNSSSDEGSTSTAALSSSRTQDDNNNSNRGGRGGPTFRRGLR